MDAVTPPTPTPFPDLCGHLDGFCIRFGGEIVDVFPTLTGAARGLSAALDALDMLDRVFARRIA